MNGLKTPYVYTLRMLKWWFLFYVNFFSQFKKKEEKTTSADRAVTLVGGSKGDWARDAERGLWSPANQGTQGHQNKVLRECLYAHFQAVLGAWLPEAQPNGSFMQLCLNILKPIPKDQNRSEDWRMKVAWDRTWNRKEVPLGHIYYILYCQAQLEGQ